MTKMTKAAELRQEIARLEAEAETLLAMATKLEAELQALEPDEELDPLPQTTSPNCTITARVSAALAAR